MKGQIYCAEFWVTQESRYDVDSDIRQHALLRVNEFLSKLNNVDVVNIIEEWDERRRSLYMIVYYKVYTEDKDEKSSATVTRDILIGNGLRPLY